MRKRLGFKRWPEKLQEPLAVLDCDGAAVTYFAYDLARSVADLSPKMRESFLAEYAQYRSRSANVEGFLESFILLDRYRTWMYWAKTDHPYDWVPEVASRECSWFLRDEPFLLKHESTRFKFA